MQTIFLIFVIIGIFCFIFGYNGWLKQHYGVSALSPSRMLVGIVDAFIWLQIGDADSIIQVLWVVGVGGVVFLLLWAVNYQQVKTAPQAFIMTLWHLVCGLAIIVIWYELTRDRKKRK